MKIMRKLAFEINRIKPASLFILGLKDYVKLAAFILSGRKYSLK